MSLCLGCDAELPPKVPGTPGVARKWCSDNCRKRTWERTNRLTCADCGALLPVGTHRDRYHSGARCQPCDIKRRGDELTERVELVARLYNEGKPINEIRVALGWNGYPGRLVDEARRRGLIGYRNRGYGRVA